MAVVTQTDPRRPHPAEATHPTIDRITAGAFVEDPRYATWRQDGTTDWLLLHTLDGHGRIGLPGDREVVTDVGDLVLLRPGARHDYGTATGAGSWSLQYAHFHPRADWLPLLDWPAVADGVLLLTVRADAFTRVRDALGQASALHRGGLRLGQQFGLNALERALLWAATQQPGADGIDPRLIGVLDHIGRHLAEPLDTARLAAVAVVSASRLTHLFTASLGVPPMRFVEQQRMQQAAQLLELTDRPVAAVARAVGYGDPLYFSARFRRHTGRAPSQYRDNARARATHDVRAGS